MDAQLTMKEVIEQYTETDWQAERILKALKQFAKEIYIQTIDEFTEQLLPEFGGVHQETIKAIAKELKGGQNNEN